MYAPNLIRVFSICNRNLAFTRQILSSQPNLNSYNFVNNLHRYKSSAENKILTSVSFSTTSSPEDSVPKAQKKRRRIISNSSSDDNETTAANKNSDNGK